MKSRERIVYVRNKSDKDQPIQIDGKTTILKAGEVAPMPKSHYYVARNNLSSISAKIPNPLEIIPDDEGTLAHAEFKKEEADKKVAASAHELSQAQKDAERAALDLETQQKLTQPLEESPAPPEPPEPPKIAPEPPRRGRPPKNS